ncbi:MAG: hypothetical protein AAGA56_24290 [Myxococcota bacterium]
MLQRIVLGLVLLVGCGRGAPPSLMSPARSTSPAPRIVAPEAPEPGLEARREPDLGYAIPGVVGGYVEARAGARSAAIVFENLYQLLGGDAISSARDLLDQAEVAGWALADLQGKDVLALARLREATAFEAWIRQTTLDQNRVSRDGVDRFDLAPGVSIAWVPGQRLLAMGAPRLVEGCIETVNGAAASLVGRVGVTVPAASDVFFVVDLPSLTKGYIREPLVGHVRPGTDVIVAEMATDPLLPGLSLPALPYPNIAERLPAQTVGYLTVSGVALEAEARLEGPRVDALIKRVAQATLFVLAAPGFRMADDLSNAATGMAAGLLIQWKTGRAPNAEERAAIEAKLPPDLLPVTWRDDEALLAIGAPGLREVGVSALRGANTLSQGAVLEAPSAQARLWLAIPGWVEIARDLLPPVALRTLSDGAPTSEIALTLTPASNAWRYHFDSSSNVLGGVALAGAASAIAIHAVRHYLVQEKISEATAQADIKWPKDLRRE